MGGFHLGDCLREVKTNQHFPPEVGPSRYPPPPASPSRPALFTGASETPPDSDCWASIWTPPTLCRPAHKVRSPLPIAGESGETPGSFRFLANIISGSACADGSLLWGLGTPSGQWDFTATPLRPTSIQAALCIHSRSRTI